MVVADDEELLTSQP